MIILTMQIEILFIFQKGCPKYHQKHKGFCVNDCTHMVCSNELVWFELSHQF